MYEKGMYVKFTNKLSGSEYDGDIIEIHPDMIVIMDDCDNVFKVPFRFWDIEVLKK